MIKPLPIETLRLQGLVDHQGYTRLALNSLLVIEGKHIVLIDPGCAEFLPSRLMREYGLEIPVSMEEELLVAGVLPEKVSDVVFTHLHFDHGSGAFTRVPGKIQKRFPNARYHVLKEHYEYAMNPHPDEADSFFTGLFKYIDQVNWLEDWTYEWMDFKTFNGHTKGMVVPMVKSDEGEVFFVSDLIPMHIFLDAEVYCGYDMDPDLLKKEKQEFLKELKGSSRIIFFHDPLINSINYP